MNAELNNNITTFLEAYGNVKSKEEWLQAYQPTASSSATQGTSSSTGANASVEWVWDENQKKYRYWDGKQWVWQ